MGFDWSQWRHCCEQPASDRDIVMDLLPLDKQLKRKKRKKVNKEKKKILESGSLLNLHNRFVPHLVNTTRAFLQERRLMERVQGEDDRSRGAA